MAHIVPLEIRDPLYRELTQVAKAEGKTVEQLALGALEDLLEERDDVRLSRRRLAASRRSGGVSLEEGLGAAQEKWAG